MKNRRLGQNIGIRSRPVPEANEMYGVETSGVEETSAGRECSALNPRKRAHLRLQRCYHWPVEISMTMTQKIIITCAVTGAIHTPSMSPYLPVTPEEIADAAIEAAKAGAAIVHVHARNPETGKPDHSLDAFKAFLPRIKEAVDVVINLTSGGAPYMKIEERIQPAVAFKPEIASLNMGSINFGLFPMLGRFKEFRYAWERDYLEGSRDLVFRNTFTDIEYALKKCADNGTRFEFECYDVGHLYNLAHFLNRGLVQPPLFVQTVFGILGGIGTHPEDVMHMKRTADRLFGEQYRWSVLGAGRNQLPIAAMAVGMGGNIRVGLEDSLWIGPGAFATSNAVQVDRARQIIEGLGLEIATPSDAREILSLKGRSKVEFYARAKICARRIVVRPPGVAKSRRRKYHRRPA
jgi:uncharacterized protein (DUF849 family)